MKKLIISTDIGTDVDDAIAVYLAATNPEIDLKAVWVTNGDVQARAHIARKLLNLASSNARVLVGEAEALTGVKPFMHGYENEFVTKEEREAKWPIEQNGLESVVKMLEEPGWTIASIGPMTNLAVLLRKYPEAAKNIDRVYAMACRLAGPEHNIAHDVQAAREVFASDIPMTIVPGETCDRYRLELGPLFFEEISHSAVEFILEMAEGWRTYQQLTGMKHIAKYADEVKFEYKGQKDYEDVQKTLELLREAVKENDLGTMYSIRLNISALGFNHPEFKEWAKQHDIPIDEISVHDAYTIFCMLHPDLTVITPASISITEDGHIQNVPGKKHDFVLNLDYQKFKEFLYKGLDLKEYKKSN